MGCAHCLPERTRAETVEDLSKTEIDLADVPSPRKTPRIAPGHSSRQSKRTSAEGTLVSECTSPSGRSESEGDATCSVSQGESSVHSNVGFDSANDQAVAGKSASGSVSKSYQLDSEVLSPNPLDNLPMLEANDIEQEHQLLSPDVLMTAAARSPTRGAHISHPSRTQGNIGVAANSNLFPHLGSVEQQETYDAQQLQHPPQHQQDIQDTLLQSPKGPTPEIHAPTGRHQPHAVFMQSQPEARLPSGSVLSEVHSELAESHDNFANDSDHSELIQQWGSKGELGRSQTPPVELSGFPSKVKLEHVSPLAQIHSGEHEAVVTTKRLSVRWADMSYPQESASTNKPANLHSLDPVPERQLEVNISAPSMDDSPTETLGQRPEDRDTFKRTKPMSSPSTATTTLSSPIDNLRLHVAYDPTNVSTLAPSRDKSAYPRISITRSVRTPGAGHIFTTPAHGQAIYHSPEQGSQLSDGIDRHELFSPPTTLQLARSHSGLVPGAHHRHSASDLPSNLHLLNSSTTFLVTTTDRSQLPPAYPISSRHHAHRSTSQHVSGTFTPLAGSVPGGPLSYTYSQFARASSSTASVSSAGSHKPPKLRRNPFPPTTPNSQNLPHTMPAEGEKVELTHNPHPEVDAEAAWERMRREATAITNHLCSVEASERMSATSSTSTTISESDWEGDLFIEALGEIQHGLAVAVPAPESVVHIPDPQTGIVVELPARPTPAPTPPFVPYLDLDAVSRTRSRRADNPSAQSCRSPRHWPTVEHLKALRDAELRRRRDLISVYREYYFGVSDPNVVPDIEVENEYFRRLVHENPSNLKPPQDRMNVDLPGLYSSASALDIDLRGVHAAAYDAMIQSALAVQNELKWRSRQARGVKTEPALARKQRLEHLAQQRDRFIKREIEEYLRRCSKRAVEEEDTRNDRPHEAPQYVARSKKGHRRVVSLKQGKELYLHQNSLGHPVPTAPLCYAGGLVAGGQPSTILNVVSSHKAHDQSAQHDDGDALTASSRPITPETTSTLSSSTWGDAPQAKLPALPEHNVPALIEEDAALLSPCTAVNPTDAVDLDATSSTSAKTSPSTMSVLLNNNPHASAARIEPIHSTSSLNLHRHTQSPNQCHHLDRVSIRKP